MGLIIIKEADSHLRLALRKIIVPINSLHIEKATGCQLSLADQSKRIGIRICGVVAHADNEIEVTLARVNIISSK